MHLDDVHDRGISTAHFVSYFYPVIKTRRSAIADYTVRGV